MGTYLSSSVPEAQGHGHAVDNDLRRVVVKDGRNILARKCVRGIGDKQAGLPVSASPQKNRQRVDRVHTTSAATQTHARVIGSVGTYLANSTVTDDDTCRVSKSEKEWRGAERKNRSG